MSKCTADNQPNNESLSTMPKPSQTFAPVETNTSTIVVLPTPTSPEPSPTSQPTWTPLPTVSADEIDSFIESMNSLCKVPCWGNINPGQTSRQEANHIVSAFGTIIESTSVYFDYHKKATVIDFTYEDEKVSSINLPTQLTKSYELHNLLTSFGLPQDVQIEVIPETAEGAQWFYLAVFYPQDGILAVFSGEGTLKDSKVSVCFTSISPDLYLVTAGRYSLEQMKSILDSSLRNILEPLEDLTGMSVKEFYDTYRDPTRQCLSTIVGAR